MELRMGKETKKTDETQSTNNKEMTLSQLREKSTNEQQSQVEDVQNLRKVIKLGSSTEQQSEQTPDKTPEINIKQEETKETKKRL